MTHLDESTVTGDGERTYFVYTVEPLHNGHLGDRRKRPLWRGGPYGEVGV